MRPAPPSAKASFTPADIIKKHFYMVFLTTDEQGPSASMALPIFCHFPRLLGFSTLSAMASDAYL